jgi:hypothetical protein
VDSQDRFDLPMVIADDDILYPSRWLQGLQESLQAFPECVSCYLAREMKLDGDRPAKYREWKVAAGTDPSIRHVAHGVNGTIFPAQFLRVLKAAGTEFLSCCPKADDIWLHVQAVRAGFETRQISKNVRRFAAIPGTQEDGLWIQNQNFGGNDRAISATYTPDDISLLGGQFADPNSEAGKDIELRTL